MGGPVSPADAPHQKRVCVCVCAEDPAGLYSAFPLFHFFSSVDALQTDAEGEQIDEGLWGGMR